MAEYKIVSELKPIELSRLHIQYVPVVTLLKIWNYDMSLLNSPHVELLKLIEHEGFDWDQILMSRFALIRQHRALYGLKQWTIDKIKEHIKQRWKIYKSIKKRGFSVKKSKDKPVVVLKQPLWKTRFGLNEKWLHGWEIYDGGRRCSALAALGHKVVYGYFAEDSKPGTKDPGRFGPKLSRVKGVFDEQPQG